VAVPGGGDTAELILAIVSLLFLAAIGAAAFRLYKANQLTLWSMTLEHRTALYGAIAVAFMALVGTSKLWQTGVGTIVWVAMLVGAGFTLFTVWNESRRYRI
jgi:hypothetical protein